MHISHDTSSASGPAIPPLVAGKAPAQTRVVVAMSGGVDSSVAAALLAEQGYEVIGITLQLYDHGAAVQKKGACCAGQDIHDARRVAEQIGIPHYVLDYESRFRESVIDEFADSYLAGRTPVPCVRCNQTVKFRDLLDTARDLGADVLATGHYVRRHEGPGGPELHRGHDPERDQSYFLFATTPEQLDFLRFPLGHLEKSETRALATSYGLKVADKPDSQDICFVPQGRYSAVVEKLRPGAVEPGEIVDREGRVLGMHDGIIHYTIGQRRGLGIAAEAPLYVVEIQPETRRVVVGPKEALAQKVVPVKELNWLAMTPVPPEGLEVEVKLRSTRPAAPAVFFRHGETAGEVHLHEPEYGVAPGQACVIYQGARVLGGGWIAEA